MKRMPVAPPVTVVSDFAGVQKFRAVIERSTGATV
jgi:hypothetical protein